MRSLGVYGSTGRRIKPTVKQEEDEKRGAFLDIGGKGMTRIFSELQTKHIDNKRFVQLTFPFRFESNVLKEAGLKYRVEVPIGFVQDFESIPLIRGRNKRGGTVHDYLSCIDSDPVVTKKIAAAVYFEINEYTDRIDEGRHIITKGFDWMRRWTKWSVVRIWPCYFHHRKVMATVLEITGVDGDPYVTIEKLDALIVKTEQVSTDLKDKDVKSDNTDENIEKTDLVIKDLKEEKQKAVDKL